MKRLSRTGGEVALNALELEWLGGVIPDALRGILSA